MKITQKAVWIVDDDLEDQLLIQSAFGQLYPAISITTLSTFSDLLTNIKEVKSLPTLLLVDLQMPGVTGFDVLHYLRGRANYTHLPIIILSDSNEEFAQQKALALGATDFILKPFSYAELNELIKQLVARWSLSTQESP